MKKNKHYIQKKFIVLKGLAVSAAVFLLCLVFIKNVFPTDHQNSLTKARYYKTIFKKEHEELVINVRKKLPELLNDLEKGDSTQRQKAAKQLGCSEDERSIKPLIKTILKDSSPSVKQTAVYSLLHLAYRTNTIPQFNEYLANDIIPTLKVAVKHEDKIIKRAAAVALYKLGDKKIALPVLESFAISGDAGILNSFFYIPELSKEGVLVSVVLPDRISDLYKIKKELDKDTHSSILNVLNSSENASVKIRAAEMVYNYNIAEGEYLIPYLRDIAINSDNLENSSHAMSLLYKIGTLESKKVLEEASQSNTKEIRRKAIHYLDYWAKKGNK